MEINVSDERWYTENVLPQFEGNETVMEAEGIEKVLVAVGEHR